MFPSSVQNGVRALGGVGLHAELCASAQDQQKWATEHNKVQIKLTATFGMQGKIDEISTNILFFF